MIRVFLFSKKKLSGAFKIAFCCSVATDQAEGTIDITQLLNNRSGISKSLFRLIASTLSKLMSQFS